MIYKKFSWRPGARFKADADKVGLELEAIRKKHNGKLKPANIVKRAKIKNSAMHCVFIWDDEQAAEEYRIHQARRLVSCLRVDVEFMENPVQDISQNVRAFVNVTDADGDRFYTSTDVALQDVDLKLQVLNAARRKVASAVADLRSLEQCADAIELLESALGILDTRILEREVVTA